MSNTWALLYKCFPTVCGILSVEEINTLRNGITLRDSFGKFTIALKPTKERFITWNSFMMALLNPKRKSAHGSILYSAWFSDLPKKMVGPVWRIQFRGATRPVLEDSLDKVPGENAARST
ncbi:hypothetical protein N7501_005119 [Penicillium viridicatum]|nr:hypothetical protein N7501_005119 [Penicillium viridicatum]